MTPFISFMHRNPAFGIAAVILGFGIAVVLHTTVLLIRQCVNNIKESGKIWKGIIYGLLGYQIIDRTPERVMSVSRAKKGSLDENGERIDYDFVAKTNRQGIIKVTVSHDKSKVMPEPYCHDVTRGKSRAAIAYYREGDNDFSSIERAINKILR